MTSGPIEDGDKIRFRAVCGIGWVLSRHLVELRRLCDSLDDDVQWLDWLDLIAKELILNYDPAADWSDVWVGDLTARLPNLTTGPKSRQQPAVTEFLKKIFAEFADPAARDFTAQFAALNHRGYEIAGQMLTSTTWSTDEVRAHWAPVPEFGIMTKYEKGAKCFYPVTDATAQRIQILVEHKGFDATHALLSYMTLEFQFLHEYVSHALPGWSNASLEEVFLMTAAYHFYAQSQPHDGIRSFLAETLRRRRPDEFSTTRDRANSFAVLVGSENYARFMLSLAITPDSQLSSTDKANLIAKLKKLPVSDAKREADCESHFRTAKPGPTEFNALRALIHP